MSQASIMAGKAAARSGCADPLSDVLDALRLRCFVANRNELAAPWGVRIPRSTGSFPEPAAPMHGLRGAFYSLISGACWLEVDGVLPPVHLKAGDVVVLLREHGYQLRDDLASSVRPIEEVAPHSRGSLPVIHGGGGTLTTFISGGFWFEDCECNRLFPALPPFIHIRADLSETGAWLEETLRFIESETSHFHPGKQCLLNQVIHVLIAQAIRAHVATLSASSGNGLIALLDPDIGQAMSHLHERPHAPWTVASLADAVAMSRSAFAARFTSLVGQPPIQYLSNLRLCRATRLLGESQASVKQVAVAVGYGSEASFSKTFKRAYGLAPGTYRRQAIARRGLQLQTIDHQ